MHYHYHANYYLKTNMNFHTQKMVIKFTNRSGKLRLQFQDLKLFAPIQHQLSSPVNHFQPHTIALHHLAHKRAAKQKENLSKQNNVSSTLLLAVVPSFFVAPCPSLVIPTESVSLCQAASLPTPTRGHSAPRPRCLFVLPNFHEM